MTPDPLVTRLGVFFSQVCVPADWTDQQAEQFLYDHEKRLVEEERKERGDATLFEPMRARESKLKRTPCADTRREGFVHISLEY